MNDRAKKRDVLKKAFCIAHESRETAAFSDGFQKRVMEKILDLERPKPKGTPHDAPKEPKRMIWRFAPAACAILALILLSLFVLKPQKEAPMIALENPEEVIIAQLFFIK